MVAGPRHDRHNLPGYFTIRSIYATYNYASPLNRIWINTVTLPPDDLSKNR